MKEVDHAATHIPLHLRGNEMFLGRPIWKNKRFVSGAVHQRPDDA